MIQESSVSLAFPSILPYKLEGNSELESINHDRFFKQFTAFYNHCRMKGENFGETKSGYYKHIFKVFSLDLKNKKLGTLTNVRGFFTVFIFPMSIINTIKIGNLPMIWAKR